MREQLVTQIALGVASGDLEVGEKLPSREEIARRFKIHANTVSNAYRELSEQGLIEFRQGSGFYVNEVATGSLEDKIEIDSLVARFFQTAQSLGFSVDEIENSLRRKLDKKKAKSFLVIESDVPLRRILVSEIKEALGARVYGISFEDFENEFAELDSNFVALSDEKPKIDALLNSGQSCVYLKSGSVPGAMEGESRPAGDSLIAVVSGWDQFLVMAKTILVAAKVDNETIITRSTAEGDWRRGLESASMIICDSLTAKELPDSKKLRIFRAISEESLNDLKQL